MTYHGDFTLSAAILEQLSTQDRRPLGGGSSDRQECQGEHHNMEDGLWEPSWVVPQVF